MTSRRRRRGLSLAEVLVALAVASISLLAMVSYFAGMHKASSEGRSQASASSVATQILEQLKADPAYLASVTAQPRFTVLEPVFDAQVARQPKIFTVEVLQEPVDSDSRYLQIAVRVFWEEGGRQREVMLETVLPSPSAT